MAASTRQSAPSKAVSVALKSAWHRQVSHEFLHLAIIIEVLPITNEGIRYGALAATEVVTRSPLVGAMVFGGLTLLIEGTAALATSEFSTGNVSHTLFD